MIGIVIAGVALLVLGAVVGKVGPKLGTTLAICLVLGWFGVLAWFGSTGNLSGPVIQDLALYLLIGLTAFLVGSNLTSRSSRSRRTHQDL